MFTSETKAILLTRAQAKTKWWIRQRTNLYGFIWTRTKYVCLCIYTHTRTQTEFHFMLRCTYQHLHTITYSHSLTQTSVTVHKMKTEYPKSLFLKFPLRTRAHILSNFICACNYTGCLAPHTNINQHWNICIIPKDNDITKKPRMRRRAR